MKRKIFASILLLTMLVQAIPFQALASSHREAPLISNDPLADNTDLYAFRSPDDPNKVTIIASYVPGQLPQGALIIILLVKTSAMRSISIIMLQLKVMILPTGSLSTFQTID